MKGGFEILQAGSFVMFISLFLSQPMNISETHLSRLALGKNTTYRADKNLKAWTGQPGMMRLDKRSK